MGHILEALKQLELKQDQQLRDQQLTEPASAPPRAEEVDPGAEREPAPKNVVSLTLPEQPAVDAAKQARFSTAFERAICGELAENGLSQRYERLAASIDAEIIEGDGSVLLTSAERDAAVADTLAHLGVLLAERNVGDVLLVDADLAGKTLTNLFKAGARNGVKEILYQGVSWADLVVPLESDRLHLLPAGRGISKSADAAPKVLPQLLDQWKQAYRFVLVDAGGADQVLARALSRLCRAVYFLVELGATDSEQAVSAVARLRAHGARLRGCIVANAPYGEA